MKNTGISFASLLGLLFIGLKLGHVINWSWWWVLSPFWIGLAVSIIIFIVVAVVFLIVGSYFSKHGLY